MAEGTCQGNLAALGDLGDTVEYCGILWNTVDVGCHLTFLLFKLVGQASKFIACTIEFNLFKKRIEVPSTALE